MSAEDEVLFDIDNHVATITLNKPEKLNAISVAMDRVINDLVFRINGDDSVRAVILTGAGDRAFCAGSDLTDLDSYGTSWQYRNRMDRNLDYAIGIWKIRKPVIAAVNGYCIGGGLEMFCASDIRLATVKSSFAAAEMKWGWHGGSGATQFLPRIVGPGHANELLMTGERIDAVEANRIGLFNHMFEDREQLLTSAKALAETIASRSPIAIEAVKKLVRVALSDSIEIGLAYENDLFTYEMRSNDAAEGRRAYAEGRAAEFTGD